MQATYVILTFLVAIYLKSKIKITNTFCLTNISKILFQMWSILKISRHFTFFFCTKSVKLGMHSVLAAHLHLERPQVQGSACGRDSVLNRAAWNCAVEAFLRRSTVLVVALVFQITFSMGKKNTEKSSLLKGIQSPISVTPATVGVYASQTLCWAHNMCRASFLKSEVCINSSYT